MKTILMGLLLFIVIMSLQGCGNPNDANLPLKSSSTEASNQHGQTTCPIFVGMGFTDPCGPFGYNDSLTADRQPGFYCILDTTVNEVACSYQDGPYIIVQNLPNPVQLPTGDSTHFCADTASQVRYCWGPDMIASPTTTPVLIVPS